MDQFLSRLLPSSNFSVADRAMTREQIVRFAFHTINVSCLFRCWSIRKWCNHRNLSDKYVYMTSRCQKENGHRVNLGDSESVSFLSRVRYKYITTHDVRTFFKEGVNISSTWHELFDFANDIFILFFFWAILWSNIRACLLGLSSWQDVLLLFRPHYSDVPRARKRCCEGLGTHCLLTSSHLPPSDAVNRPRSSTTSHLI